MRVPGASERLLYSVERVPRSVTSGPRPARHANGAALTVSGSRQPARAAAVPSAAPSPPAQPPEMRSCAPAAAARRALRLRRWIAVRTSRDARAGFVSAAARSISVRARCASAGTMGGSDSPAQTAPASARSMARRTASTPRGSWRQPSEPAHVSSVQASPSSQSASPPGQGGTVVVVDVVVTTSVPRAPADGEASAGSRATASRIPDRMASDVLLFPRGEGSNRHAAPGDCFGLRGTLASRAAAASRTRVAWRRCLSERAGEQAVDRGPPVVLEEARARAAEVRLGDDWIAEGFPRVARPAEPAVARLVEDVDRLVEELGELGRHARSTRDRVVRLDAADHEDLATVVHLVPDALQDFPEERGVGVAAVHQLRQVGEAHVALAELRTREDADAAAPGVAVTLEGEVHLVDAVALGGLAEGGFGALGRAAEEDAVLGKHGRRP